jgi:phosphatidylserine/phosphatidylglycerophosphate/cardiolipin synthase-like enzyme
MKLIVQPDHGVKPLVDGIDRAKRSVEIAIFRFDRKEVEHALENAVKRGVFVHALIADTNCSGEKNLRRLEMRLLAKGVTVARTSDDLVRYHGKLMIVDRRQLYVLAFNFTHLDIDRSRSFGIVTANRQFVQEAVRLFEADTTRQPFVPKSDKFVVSPLNARESLSAFVKGARHELLIYDSKITDRAMIRLLEDRAKAGVEIRVVGQMTKRSSKLSVRKLGRMRLHTRTIVRDRKLAFVGSQSLRELELDARREVGVIIRDSRTVSGIVQVFETDWASVGVPESEPAKTEPTSVIAEAAARTAKAIAKDLGPVAPVLEKAVQQALGKGADFTLDEKEVEANARAAVREAVKGAVKELVRDVAERAKAANGN